MKGQPWNTNDFIVILQGSITLSQLRWSMWVPWVWRVTAQVWRNREDRFFLCLLCLPSGGPLITDCLPQLREGTDGCWELSCVLLCYLNSHERGTASKASFGRIGFPLLLNVCFVLIEISHNDEGSGSKKGYSCWAVNQENIFAVQIFLKVSLHEWKSFFPLRQQRNLGKSQQISHKHCSTSHQGRIALCGVWELLIVAANCSHCGNVLVDTYKRHLFFKKPVRVMQNVYAKHDQLYINEC